MTSQNKKLVAAMLGLILSQTEIAGEAKAHEWYPRECCSGKDCARVISKRNLPDGNIEVTTEHGTAIFPKNFSKRPSEDGEEHACFNPENKRPLCYFVPAES